MKLSPSCLLRSHAPSRPAASLLLALPCSPLPALLLYLRPLDLLVRKRQRPKQALCRGEEREQCQGKEDRTCAAAAGRHSVVVLQETCACVEAGEMKKLKKAGIFFLITSSSFSWSMRVFSTGGIVNKARACPTTRGRKKNLRRTSTPRAKATWWIALLHAAHSASKLHTLKSSSTWA